MKRTIIFLAAILISSAAFLTSCTEDEDPANLPPTISFLTADTLISSNGNVFVGETFYVGINAIANSTSNSKIESLRVTRIYNNQMVGDDTFPYNDDNISVIISFNGLNETGTENIEFTVTDKDGQTAKKSLQITYLENKTPIVSFTMKVLGSYQSTTGSSFASIDGSVYTMAEAFANQAKVDFLYWWGASTSATIGAPDDANANAVYTGVNGLPNWTTKNATRFKTTSIPISEFDAIDDGQVLATNASGADQTRIGSLMVENVIAFVTVSGKHGLIKVTDITVGVAGDVTIDVKVEE
jgi:hypothetical protein